MARFLSDDLTDRDKKKMEREKIASVEKKPLPFPLKVLLILSIATAAVLLGVFLTKLYNDNKKAVEAPPEEEAPLISSGVSDNDLLAEGTVIILNTDLDNKTIRFRDPESGDEYMLNFTDSTVYTDLKGRPLVAEQLSPGDIVDIIVSVHSSNLRSVKRNEDPEAFELADITDFTINENKGVFSVAGENYRIIPGTLVLAKGEPTTLKHIEKGDVLTIKGIGKDIYTVSESSGTGYVRVIGAESFKGGWIEIGKEIRPIEDEMLIPVPEGSYTMNVSYMHFGGKKNVNVRRGRETVVNVSDLKGDLLKTGTITFSIEPVEAEAEISIDGKRILRDEPLTLDYGVHTLDIKAEGYIPIHKYLKVGEEKAHLSIMLEKDEEKTASANSSDKNTGKKKDADKEDKDDKDDKKDDKKEDVIPSEALPEVFRSKTGSSSVKNKEEEKEENTAPSDIETVTTDSGQLYIDGPSDTEVYFDGAYKGIAPCHFKKSAGTHVITLMKNGYETKSYTLNLSSGNENEAYSFNELIEEHDI